MARLEQEVIDTIIGMHYVHDGNAGKVSKEVKVGRRVIIKYWRVVDLEVKSRGREKGVYHLISDESVSDIYMKYKGVAREAERQTGISRTTYLKRWRRLGYKIKSQGRQRL